jgi:CheY-like chemotaxis protein
MAVRGAERRSVRHKKRILLTDESPVVLKRVTGILEEAGFKVYSATDSAKAWKLAAKVRPDVAVLDIAMRGMGRFGVAIQMNASLATYRILYLFLAARNPDRNAKHSKDVRAVAFLKKPFAKRKLLKLIESLLSAGAPPRA